MASNKFAGVCYRCGNEVPAGEGYAEKVRPGHQDKKWPGAILPRTWMVQHKSCAARYRGTATHHIFQPDLSLKG